MRWPATSLADAPADRQPGGGRPAAGGRGAAAVGSQRIGGRRVAIRSASLRRVGRRRRPLLHSIHPFTVRHLRRPLCRRHQTTRLLWNYHKGESNINKRLNSIKILELGSFFTANKR
jgi:hypothetical protein